MENCTAEHVLSCIHLKQRYALKLIIGGTHVPPMINFRSEHITHFVHAVNRATISAIKDDNIDKTVAQ